MNAWLVTGMGLALAGALILSGLIPMATVSYIDPDEILTLSPDGTRDAPTPAVAGSQINLMVQLRAYDSYENLALPSWESPDNWEVKAAVSSGDVVYFSNPEKVASGLPSNPTRVTYIWYESWKVPEEYGALYSITWTITIRDESGASAGEIARTTYVTTDPAVPDGYFLINGRNVDMDTTLTVFSPSLSFRFIPTSEATRISGAYVVVSEGKTVVARMELVPQGDGTYAGTFTLPNQGVYSVNGYMNTTEGASIRLLSVLVPLDTDQDSVFYDPFYESQPDGQYSISTIIGACLITAGVTVAVVGMRRGKS